MKKFFLIILYFLFIFNCFSQYVNTIKISPKLYLRQITENIYIHISQKYIDGYGNVLANGLLYITQDFALLIDTPWDNELTRELYEYVLNNFEVKIKSVIVTHSHDDCMGGLAELIHRGAISYCYELTKEFAIRDSLPIPTISFIDSLKLKYNSVNFNLYFLGAGHTYDNIVVYIPQYKILFAGCLIKSANSTNLGNVSEGNLKEYPKTLNKIIHKFPDVEIVIPGHGDYGGIELIEHTLKLANDYEK